MPDFIGARDRVLARLSEELVGPKPVGEPLDTSSAVRFDSWELAAGPWHDSATGEEILTAAGPATRYGIGVLFPDGPSQSGEPAAAGGDSDAERDVVPDEKQMPDEDFDELSHSIRDSLQGAGGGSGDDDDFDLAAANAYKPSSMAITCRVHLPSGSRIALTAEFGRYREFSARIGTAERSWFCRQPVTLRAAFTAEDLARSAGRKRIAEDPSASDRHGDDGLSIEVGAYSRPTADPSERLVTFYVANGTTGRKDTASLFQAGFKVLAEDGAAVLPYRVAAGPLSDDPEQESIALLYRKHETFAIGHGCAADWGQPDTDGRVSWVEATVLPVYETPSITPLIRLRSGADLQVDMRVLADAYRAVEADQQIGALLGAYAAWIEDRRAEAGSLPEGVRGAAVTHLRECAEALGRMRGGWELVRSDPTVRKAFVLTNRAMLTQQARSSGGLRATTVDAEGFFKFDGSPPISEPGSSRGIWRPFQIAFFLAVLESVANGDSEHRDTVELIFFPTGGGKTEAYLAVAAFSMFLRRLRDNDDDGTDVIMRYTLRLLTTQQFLRASTLICAMEELRERTPELGRAEFSIGIWVGGESTPNRRAEAVNAFNKLSSGGQNRFLLLRCPWCNAGFGPVRDHQRSKRKSYAVSGYAKEDRSVRFRCSDRQCHFSRRQLPVYVVDDDLYEVRPSLVIGTIDKFAMLAWRPDARALFGLGQHGERVVSPPGLVIQDELHLISGPLGSMSGLYEAVIEDLCTDPRGGHIRPKIVASTATIRRYREQVLSLYGREDTRLFPPHGLTADDSFFARWARRDNGTLEPGRQYVGVHGPGLGSMQTLQVRTASALLQAPMELAPEERDPWWTCLTFFNSLRELGNTLTLLQADIPTYLGGLHARDGLDRRRQRWPRRTPELTSRLKNDQIPQAIADLEIGVDDRRCIDVCLASSIIEVGIDIDRLSLMTVVGQPKTTSQYIQVTGRVGRRWQERPGLVVTLYGAAKPRDRSHFEQFRSYHERLYAQVEPTSVTPFALPVLERAVHAALATYVRQRGPSRQKPLPFPSKLVEEAADLLRRRAKTVGGVDPADLERVLEKRLRQWRMGERTEWDANPEYGDPATGLMRFPGTAVREELRRVTWETPSSMRNVDANCRIQLTSEYAARDAELPEGDEL